MRPEQEYLNGRRGDGSGQLEGAAKDRWGSGARDDRGDYGMETRRLLQTGSTPGWV